MSPTSYQTAPPREIILAESQGSVKPGHRARRTDASAFFNLYFALREPERALLRDFRAVIQIISGGVLPNSRHDFAGTYCASTISKPALRTAPSISARVNLQPRQVSLCVTLSRTDARIPAGRPKKCQRAIPPVFRTRWLSFI